MQWLDEHFTVLSPPQKIDTFYLDNFIYWLHSGCEETLPHYNTNVPGKRKLESTVEMLNYTQKLVDWQRKANCSQHSKLLSKYLFYLTHFIKCFIREKRQTLQWQSTLIVWLLKNKYALWRNIHNKYNCVTEDIWHLKSDHFWCLLQMSSASLFDFLTENVFLFFCTWSCIKRKIENYIFDAHVQTKIFTRGIYG